MAKSDKMYKDGPKIERNEEGKTVVKKGGKAGDGKKPSEGEKKVEQAETQTDGIEVPVKEMHERHASEMKDMHKRHEKELKGIMEKHGAKESGEGEKVEKAKKD